MIKLVLITNSEREDVANIIKENLEIIGLKTTVKIINNNYYKYNIEKLDCDILLTGNTVSIKPEIQDYLTFEIENKESKEQTYKNIYGNFNNSPNFMGLYFDSINIIYSKKVKGNFRGNWYNIFYNIDTWYKIK